MAGTVIVDTINSSVAGTPPVFQASGTEIGTLCRAWVNFNGTGTVAIRASFNVSSITDNGTGNYTVNFTNALTDANYSTTGSVSNDAASVMGFQPTTRLASSVTVLSRDTTTGANTDTSSISVSVFR